MIWNNWKYDTAQHVQQSDSLNTIGSNNEFIMFVSSLSINVLVWNIILILITLTQQDQRNQGKMSPRKLRHSGTFDQFGEDISTMCQKEYGRFFFRSEEANSKKI